MPCETPVVPVPFLAPPRALAWSEAAVSDVSLRGPSLALWRPKGMTVAIGISQNPEAEMDLEAAGRDGVELVRRQSGGGAVLLYDGVLCWEAWAGFKELDALREGGSGIRPAYKVLCDPVLEALTELGIQAFQAGISDVSVITHHAGDSREGSGTARKMAGTAQLRRKESVLVHGALLVCPDVDMLAAYLKMPDVQPEYRENRSHRDFCVSVAEVLRWMGGREELMRMITGGVAKAAWRGGWNVVEAGCGKWRSRMEELESGKYLSREWNWERKRTIV